MWRTNGRDTAWHYSDTRIYTHPLLIQTDSDIGESWEHRATLREWERAADSRYVGIRRSKLKKKREACHIYHLKDEIIEFYMKGELILVATISQVLWIELLYLFEKILLQKESFISEVNKKWCNKIS